MDAQLRSCEICRQEETPEAQSRSLESTAGLQRRCSSSAPPEPESSLPATRVAESRKNSKTGIVQKATVTVDVNPHFSLRNQTTFQPTQYTTAHHTIHSKQCSLCLASYTKWIWLLIRIKTFLNLNRLLMRSHCTTANIALISHCITARQFFLILSDFAIYINIFSWALNINRFLYILKTIRNNKNTALHLFQKSWS